MRVDPLFGPSNDARTDHGILVEQDCDPTRCDAGHRLLEAEPESLLRGLDAGGDRVGAVAQLRLDPLEGRLYLPLERAEAKLRYRSDPCPRASSPPRRASGSSSTSRRRRVAPGQVAVLYDDDAVVGAGIILGAKG